MASDEETNFQSFIDCNNNIDNNTIYKIMTTRAHDFDLSGDHMFDWIRNLCLSYPHTSVYMSFEHCRVAFSTDSIEDMFRIMEMTMDPILSRRVDNRLDRCVQSLDVLKHMSETYPSFYRLFLNIIYELHPAIKTIRQEIYMELHLLQRVHSTINGVLNLINTYDAYIPKHTLKAETSQRESLAFLALYKNRLADAPRMVAHHHGMLASSLPRNDQSIVDCLGSCFQDIYFLETVVHACNIPSAADKDVYIHYSSMKMMEMLYQSMYARIMDSESWTTVLTDKNDKAILKMHAYLPHPEDFVYMERPWKNVLRRRAARAGTAYVLYASAPLPVNRFMTRKLMSLL